MERLTERNPLWIDDEMWERACEPDCEEIDAVYRKLKEYEDAEEQGLLLRLPAPLNGVESFSLDGKTTWYRLPCCIGDTVYVIDGATLKGHDWKYLTYEKAYVRETIFVIEHINSFGKTVFLTREEAEAKLKEMGGANMTLDEQISFCEE